LPCHLFPRGQCRRAVGGSAGQGVPWCCAWEPELRGLFAAYVEAKQRQHGLDDDDLFLYWAQMMCDPAIAADLSARFDHDRLADVTVLRVWATSELMQRTEIAKT
jgi:hypothetical protein